jgi:G3E family GTPase
MGTEYVKDGIPVVDSIVTVVDALRMKDEFGSGKDLLRPGLAEDDIENLVIQQIEFCNIILLNKASELQPDELGRIREIIRAIQPKAEIIDCDYCDVDLQRLLYTGLFDFDRVATSATWINEIEGHHDDDDDDDDESEHSDHSEHSEEHHHHHHHHHHDDDEGEAEEYGISTFVYYRREPMNLGRFDEFIARHWPKEIIRAKGICWFVSEPDTCYLFEQAGRQVSLRDVGQWYATMPDNELLDFMQRHPDLVRDWDDTYGDRMQKLVFIGQHLDRDAITAALDTCISKGY